MKTIIVDDEPIMIRSFVRQSKNIKEISIVGEFQFPEEALEFVKNNTVNLAVLDIQMPKITGIQLAKQLRDINPNILIVFITAYEEYIREANDVNADYYIVKPYTEETLQNMASKMNLLAKRQEKTIFVQMFGRFNIYKSGVPIKLNGKAKEILALVASKRGKEISNEEIYSTIWEEREYSNIQMKVYYNALSRLKKALEEQDLLPLLTSTTRGQIFNVDMVDCDYYNWLDNDLRPRDKFDGELLSEYSWGEYLLADMMEKTWNISNN